MDDWQHEAIRHDLGTLARQVRDLEAELDLVQRRLARFEEFEQRVIRKWKSEGLE
jgi:hypothetical protein